MNRENKFEINIEQIKEFSFNAYKAGYKDAVGYSQAISKVKMIISELALLKSK